MGTQKLGCKDRFYQEIGEGSHFSSPLHKQCCSQCITVNTMIYLDIMLKHIRTSTEICCADSRSTLSTACHSLVLLLGKGEIKIDITADSCASAQLPYCYIAVQSVSAKYP